MFTKTKINYVKSVTEMNKHLQFCHKYLIRTDDMSFDLRDKSVHNSRFYKLSVKFTTLELEYTPHFDKYQKFVFKLDGSDVAEHKTGMDCFALLQRMSKSAVIDLTETEFYDKTNNKWKVLSNSGLIWFNPKFKNKRVNNCYGYDLNSSYSWAMLQDMPDTSVKPKSGILKNGEVGFNHDIKGFCETEYLYLETKAGERCQYIFPKIESPFKKFVSYYYNKKQNAKTKNERQKYKDILNFGVGFIRRKNPFIHAAILSYAKYNIEQYINPKTVIYCNTDSIVSTIERNDLKLGNDVGLFKLEHNDSFAVSQSGYQWGFDVPSVRGKSKQWFKQSFPNGFDILKDTLPFIESNTYYFDEKLFKIMKRSC